ncbi:MAG: hydrogen peroxide-inducible genes activator [Pseudomonadales bacterium]|nr:hydrogen peroxide-inducible genes activator [Pseudomonadales bacterium]
MQEQNLSLKQLRYFLMAGKHRSLRQAARELGISQPSLSAQLRLLEDTLGAALFERTRGGVLLTPLARELLPLTQAAVNAAAAIIETANYKTKGPAGTFRLGVSPSLGPYVLPWILPGMHQKFRDVKFYVREDVPKLLAEGLYAGRYDVIFTTLPLEDDSLAIMPLFREPVYLVMNANHALAKNATIGALQLAGLEILTIEEHHLFFRQVEDLCRRFDAKILRDYEGTSLDAIRQMVYMEMGVAFMPALYIRSEIRDREDLRVLGIREEPIYRVHALAWRNTSPLRAFYRELGEFFKASIEKQFRDDVVLL